MAIKIGSVEGKQFLDALEIEKLDLTHVLNHCTYRQPVHKSLLSEMWRLSLHHIACVVSSSGHSVGQLDGQRNEHLFC